VRFQPAALNQLNDQLPHSGQLKGFGGIWKRGGKGEKGAAQQCPRKRQGAYRQSRVAFKNEPPSAGRVPTLASLREKILGERRGWPQRENQ